MQIAERINSKLFAFDSVKRQFKARHDVLRIMGHKPFARLYSENARISEIGFFLASQRTGVAQCFLFVRVLRSGDRVTGWLFKPLLNTGATGVELIITND